MRLVNYDLHSLNTMLSESSCSYTICNDGEDEDYRSYYISSSSSLSPYDGYHDQVNNYWRPLAHALKTPDYTSNYKLALVLVFMLEVRLEDVPLYVNSPYRLAREIAKYRMEVGV